MRESERKAAAAAASRVVSPNQLLHTRIRNDPVVVAAFNTMNTLDYCTVWWVTQFGIECIARREASATDAQKAEFKSYKNFVTRNKKKAEAGFLHLKVTPFSTPNRAAATAAAAVEGQPWVPVGSTLGPRFFSGIRVSRSRKLFGKTWIPV